MYVTATSPYIFMLILCIRMAFLPGAKDGLLFYLVPDFEKIKDMQVNIVFKDLLFKKILSVRIQNTEMTAF